MSRPGNYCLETLRAAVADAGLHAPDVSKWTVGMQVHHWESYFPSIGEFATTFGVLAGLVLIYGFLVRRLPIHSEEPLDDAPGPEPVTMARVSESYS